ncbi:MAG TPA: mycofactocin precursor MftA [Streptosporangiaceae bacterium]
MALSANTWEVQVEQQALVQPAAQDHEDEEMLADDELLVEEVSIDGMCGVY